MIIIQDNIVLEISNDGLSAYLNILAKDETTIEYNSEKIISEIEKYIKFGLNRNILREIDGNNIDFEKKCIAKGKEAINGQDGKIKLFFQPDKIGRASCRERV